MERVLFQCHESVLVPLGAEVGVLQEVDEREQVVMFLQMLVQGMGVQCRGLSESLPCTGVPGGQFLKLCFDRVQHVGCIIEVVSH